MTDDNRSRDLSQPLEKLHPDERLKAESDYLRGSIAESLLDPITGAVSERDAKLTKFHGIYQQDDRDLRSERRHQKLEPAYQFMIRVRLPGGVCRPDQWLALARLAQDHGGGTLRLTTRQTFQFHGVLKRDLKKLMQGINATGLDTVAACGDDNRGVMCAANPWQSRVHAEVRSLSKTISDRLAWQSGAYREIWLDAERAGNSGDEVVEPLYGRTYMPRKFKIGFAVPPVNDIDVYTQDLGFIAIVDDGELAGFNICVGGGMGRTDNEPATYPQMARVIGFCRPHQAIDVAERIVSIQRDYGDRVDRAHARMKYTIDDRGLDWFRDKLEERLDWPLEAARDYTFEHNGDRYGWVQGDDGNWHYTLFIENGRVRDRDDYPLMSGLHAIAAEHDGMLLLTPNQNLTIASVTPDKRDAINKLMQDYSLHEPAYYSALRRSSIACVAFPTCGLAMAESERYLPDLVTKLETIMQASGIGSDSIVVRMSGCNNGCSRPYIAEIGFSGRGPGKYNVYLGGGHHGQRLAKSYLDNVDEATILEHLEPMIRHYAQERDAGEPFGDFVIRAGYIVEVRDGREFNN